MLSIAIPIYNYSVYEFVSSLRKQCLACEITFEILCLDDASPENQAKQANQLLQQLEHVVYQELADNLGRSAIRNKLVSIAKYDNVLFLDCDGALPKDDFIKNYMSSVGSADIVVGGRSYLKQKPKQQDLLHWTYGSSREVTTAAERSLRPYQGFLSNNFLITKHVAERLRFDEEITGYGHEDSLFGKRLEIEKISILHINNPVDHVGLDENSAFLAKTEEALKNLLFIEKKAANLNIKILKWYRKTRPILKVIYNLGGERLMNYFRNNLQSSNPNLRYFDLLRLLILVKIENKDYD